MKPPRLLALSLILASGLLSPPAAAFPVNFGNSYVPAPSHGLLLAIPSMAVDGSAASGWSYVDLGLAERVSVTVDSLYLGLKGVGHDFGTTYLGLGLASQPAPWVTARLSPLIGLKTGPFGTSQAGIRGYFDFQLPLDLTLYTMPAYYQPLDRAVAPSLQFNASLEKRLSPALSAAVELLSGTPAWQFGPNTRLAVSPGLTLALGSFSLQAALRMPLVASAGSANREAPTGVFCLGYGW